MFFFFTQSNTTKFQGGIKSEKLNNYILTNAFELRRILQWLIIYWGVTEKGTEKSFNLHCVKSVRIRSYSVQIRENTDQN